MTTFASSQPASVEQRERTFFLTMAIALAATTTLAFGTALMVGFSSFGAPWWVHIHAVTFVSWMVLYLTQNWLVWRGDLGRHRRLGRIGAVLAGWMVLVGLLLTALTLVAGRVPPIFTPAYFLALDWINVLVFAGMFALAIKHVRRTDWHRRLMLCATIVLLPPAFGRINLLLLDNLDIPQLGAAGLQALEISVYILAAMAFDRFNRGKVHPAYFWGLGALLTFGVLTPLLSSFGPFAALANYFVS